MFKPRAVLQLDIPKFGSRTESVVLHPQVVEAKLTKNNHLVADELVVTVGWNDSGFEPRVSKYARGGFWMWDQAREEFDEVKHLRFTGVCVKVDKKLLDNGWNTEFTFHDYTTLFIHHKPLSTAAQPNWSDTLQQVWERICDNTGSQDPANGKIISNVSALRDHLRFTSNEIASRTIGDMVPDRFHAISKPTPPRFASSWDFWQWCIGSLGLVSYISKDECIVTNTVEHYKTQNAVRAIYGNDLNSIDGSNIHTLEEDADFALTAKGIMLRSFDHLRGRTIEAFYPPPGDERIKTKRAAVGKRSEGGTSITANEVSGSYEEYINWSIQDQAALDRAAKEAYEERSRQELHGSFKTVDMRLESRNGSFVDILELAAGDALAIEIDQHVKDTLHGLVGGESAQIRYLVDRLGYDPDVAKLIVQNFNVDELATNIFHVKSVETSLTPTSFEVEVTWHNLITVS